MGFFKELFNPTSKTPDLALDEAMARGLSTSEAAHAAYEWLQSNEPTLAEAFTQADIELALDDRGWLVGGKRMAGELDPLSRQVQVNRSRYYWLRDPLVKQAVRLWTDYALGGTAMTWKSKDQATQDKLDTFMLDKRNRRYTSKMGQRRLSQRLLVDGELFLAFYTDGTIRMFDCLQITDIITDPDDEDTVVGYKRVTNGSTTADSKKTIYYRPWNYDGDAPKYAYGELQPYYGGEPQKIEMSYEPDVVMYHLAFDPMDKRGTTLISASSDWSREHRRFMTARVALTEALSRFAFKATVKGGQKQVNSIRAKMESTFSQTGLSGGTEHQPPNAPGGLFIANDGVSLEASPRSTGATEAKADADNLKLQVCAGTGIMLHYFGDPSTGNLATATAMELPMLKMFDAYQELWKDAWRDMFSIVLEEDEAEVNDEIEISLPDIIEEDLQKLGTFLTTFTATFPEAKVPAVMKRCLESMDMQGVDDLMDEIAANKIAMDKQAKQDAKDAQTHGLAMAKATGPVQKVSAAPVGGVPTNTDTNEAILESLRSLIQILS